MFKCNLCNKKFNFKSKLNEHTNRKKPCNESKKEYKCELCSVVFVRPAEQRRHEKTEKHINNYNKLNNIDKNKTETENKTENDNLKLEVLYLNDKIKDLENKIIILENKHKLTMDDLENKNQLIINKLQHLETENQNLKNNQKLHINHETIYIIHCA